MNLIEIVLLFLLLQGETKASLMLGKLLCLITAVNVEYKTGLVIESKMTTKQFV